MQNDIKKKRSSHKMLCDLIDSKGYMIKKFMVKLEMYYVYNYVKAIKYGIHVEYLYKAKLLKEYKINTLQRTKVNWKQINTI